MQVDHIKAFLETMCEYNTTRINQVFTSEEGHSLSIRCLPDTRTFEITDSQTQEIRYNDSVEETAEYVIAFLASHNFSSNS
ncbi:hypothetical protein [Planomicrobium sp. CPCC 101110]|uniref:hypothetical protein n=1 Tax=Planomicrobium sp. CPCC 101110 TaxID=2599619 RepID=UPI0011B49817|nr:hypothetical protein [Planomicrobium sp. CPCC 101110]TWT25816.1 hypothetical protein FQV30_08430 [Planomicrobium sp. CPCC 101110]